MKKATLRWFTGKIFKATKACDLLIVDDNSPDGTGAIADGISKRDKRVFVLHRKEKLGLGSAYVHGMKYALKQGYKNVIAMDARAFLILIQ